MEKYYINIKTNIKGEHEVHKLGCRLMPEPEDREYLGRFPSCFAAVFEASGRYRKTNGCPTCSNVCHIK